jgi:hypothetical protein
VKFAAGKLTSLSNPPKAGMNTPDLDQLVVSYKKAVDDWISTIRSEEGLATPDHSVTVMEKRDKACFTEQDAATRASEAREAYRSALRNLNYDF